MTARPLTPRQRYVLTVLANRGATHCKDWSAWHPLDEAQVRRAIDSLSRRGLVDVAGTHFRHNRRGGAWGNAAHLRTFKLTPKGKGVVDAMTEDERSAPP